MNVYQNFIENNLRAIKKQANQAYIEFAKEKEQFFDRWCHSQQINGSYDQLLLLEFKNCVSAELKIYLNDREVDTLCLAARCADEYSITHKDTSIKIPPKFSEAKLPHLRDSVPKIQYN